MDWLSANWVWVLVGIAFLTMHMSGHEGHGRRVSGKASREEVEGRDEDAPAGHSH